MIWSRSINESGRILIEPPVIDLVRGFCQNQLSRPESGGILLGYRRGSHLHIVAATIPQPDDKRLRYHFFRCDPNHQKAAYRQWERSGNTMDYVGEWHTHPEAKPTPSSLDMSEWKKICSARKESMVFIIVGLAGVFWVGEGQGKSIFQSTETNELNGSS